MKAYFDRFCSLCAVFLALVLLAFAANDVMAETNTGIFFDPDYPGEGAFVFNRDDDVFLAFFTYVDVCRHSRLADLRVFDEDEEGRRHCRSRRLQQWFITELCDMSTGEMICPIYLTVARGPELDAPLADVIDIGLARIRLSASGFRMLVLQTGDVLDSSSEIYHRDFDFREFVFGPSEVNPICKHDCPE